MKEPNRVRKSDIKYNVTLNDEQKAAKQLIIDNQIVIVTGRAGSGKSLICAQTALDFLMTKQCNHIFVTRATIEVGNSLGFLIRTPSPFFMKLPSLKKAIPLIVETSPPVIRVFTKS